MLFLQYNDYSKEKRLGSIGIQAVGEHLGDTLKLHFEYTMFLPFCQGAALLVNIKGRRDNMVYIDAVHYESDSYGNECIAKMKWTNDLSQTASSECTKKQMIDFINQHPNCTKTKYLRYGRWVTGEDVRVVDNSYLRTDANNIKADNLGALPRY